MAGRNALDFERIDRKFQSDTTRKAIEAFELKFKVDSEHSDDLITIRLCLKYFLKFKILYLFSAIPQATNPNREAILRDLYEFFSSFLICRESTRNEEFLSETIQQLIDLPINVITSQASIAPIHALADIFSLALLRSEQEVLDFELKLDGTILENVNHEYGFFSKINFVFCN